MRVIKRSLRWWEMIEQSGKRYAKTCRFSAAAIADCYFFLLLTASLSCFPALNLTVFVAGILIRSAVYGL